MNANELPESFIRCMSDKDRRKHCVRLSGYDTETKQWAGKPVERESDLHQSIMDYCKRGWPEWPCIHSSMSHRTHATLGAPDFVILAPGRLALFIECKSKTGKRTAEQLAFAKQAEMVGHMVYEVRSMDDFNAVLKEVGL